MRWAWFGLAVLVGAILGVFVTLWMPTPDPGLAQQTEDLDRALATQATQFGIWIHLGILVIAAISAGLLFWSFYLQLFHPSLRAAAWFGRSLLCYVLAAGGGAVLLYRAINWALQQRETTLLRQALNDLEAARLVSYSASVFPIGWRVGIHVDMLAMCLAGIVFGFLIYLGARKALTL